MRTITEKFKVYKFNEASIELRDKIRDEVHYNWDIYSHSMQERIETLKKFAEFINGKLDYSISCVPDRGEYIELNPKDGITFNELDSNILEFINSKKDCELTGVCYDEDIKEFLRKNRKKTKQYDYIDHALSDYLESIHKEYEFMLTDEYLCEFCESNDYEFKEDGTLY